MSAAVTPAQVLNAAADLIEPEGAWKQHGGNLRTCWCAGEAIAHVTVDLDLLDRWVAIGAANNCLGLLTRQETIPWNDVPGRTQSEVVAALRKAAELAKEPI
jgi:predicted Abi (CAAX) family protease